MKRCKEGGYSREFLWGWGVLPRPPNHDPISDQIMSISTLVFRPGLWNLYPFSLRNSWGWLVASLLRLERQQKRFLKIHFELAHFSFFLIHSELIRWINTFIHTRSFLENHTISVYPCSDQNGAKTLRGGGGATRWGGTYLYGLYTGVHPPPPPPPRQKVFQLRAVFRLMLS